MSRERRRATTALWYVDILAANGMIAKVGDAGDGRRSLVNTTATLRTAIDDWLDQAEAGLAVAGWTLPSKAMPDQH